MDQPKLFLSYAGQNLAARDIHARLRAQRFECFDFQAEPLKLSQNIVQKTTEVARTSDALVLLLDEAALASGHVAAEVQSALDSHVRILCLVSAEADAKRGAWGSPFNRLLAVKWVVIDFARLESIESAVREVCDALGVEHAPRMEEDPNFPVASRLYAELRGIFAARRDYGNGTYRALLQLTEAAHGAYTRKEYRLAATALAALTNLQQVEFPTSYPFYARIASALCAMHLERWDEAITLISDCEAVAQRSPVLERDPTLVGVRAILDFQLLQFPKAREGFKRVLALGSTDASDHCYYLFCRVHCCESVDVDRELEAIGKLPDAARNARQMQITRARVYALTGRLEEARAIFDELELSDTELQERVDYADVLVRLGHTAQADLLLAKHRAGGSSDHVFQRAWCKAQVTRGSPKDAEAACRAFIAAFPGDRFGLYSVLECLRSNGQRSPAQSLVAEAILASFTDNPPASAVDFHAAGAANAVLGRMERAQYDFERARL
jgi:tetratricopeptide (TPR) repeat protein